MKELLITLVGHPGAGKSEACDYLREQWGFAPFSASNFLRRSALARNMLLYGRQEFAAYYRQMIRQDPDFMTRAILGSEALRICIDGLRSPRDIERLREDGGFVIALIASAETRHQRVLNDALRTDVRRPPSLDDFVAQQAHDASDDPQFPNTQSAIDAADFVIDTEAMSVRDMRQALDNIIKELLGETDPNPQTP